MNIKPLVKEKLSIQKLLAPAALVILYVFFCFAGKNFSSMDTLKSILERTYYVGLLAFGVTFVIISGGIDLSIGTNMMMAALIGGYFISKGYNIWLSLAMIVVITTVVGFINGTLISRLKLPPFIATLGMMMLTQGFGSIVTKVQTQRFPPSFDELGTYKSVFYKTKDGFPSGVVYMMIFFVVAAVMLSKTRFGRYVYATGSNEEALRLSGVNVALWKTLTYTIGGFFCGLAGIAYASTYTTIIPGTGNGEELNAIAAVIIGGTSMAGGAGTMTGTLIGALMMSVLKSGLMAMGLQGQYQVFFTGLVVILAVLLDIYRNKKASKPK